MEYIDTHVHLWHDDFSAILPNVVTRAHQSGVSHFVVPGINRKTSEKAIDLAQEYHAIIPAIGLHPTEPEEPLNAFVGLVQKSEVKAIGEVGIDRRAGDWDKQEKRLRFFLELAIKTDKPVIMHLLHDWKPVLAIIADYPDLRGKVVWHCFTADSAAADKMMQLDIYLSCTAILARKRMEATQEAIKNWPLNRLMLETDGPWLAWPGEVGPNEPTTVLRIAEVISSIKNCSTEEIAKSTTDTAKKFFRIE